MKNVTDFCKTVETGVDLHLPLSFVKQRRYHKKNSPSFLTVCKLILAMRQ